MASHRRDKILKEGAVRHRQNTIGLQKWRPRHLVFKVTHAGRLQLIVYKEYPPTAANEIKEISIDEFGGLEHSLKIDNERYVFAIITNVTECFSTETPRELGEWRKLLQEYLGKELLVSITVPTRQHQLKPGKATLRIRNTGFTITTCENPPRCQGTWHIIHIRKYGGTDSFRFQTGSKCPTGENMYTIETKDVAGLKSVFNDLSNHKPIFTDDRLGRRMTLERNFHKNAQNQLPSRSGPNRLSLQTAGRDTGKHLYENHDQVQTTLDPSIQYGNIRRASFDDGVFNQARADSAPSRNQSTPSRKASNFEEESKLYQNLHAGRNSQQDRASPTKRLHLSALNVPIAEGYYNVEPPLLVKKQLSTNITPPSSPEEGVFHEQMFLRSTTVPEGAPDYHEHYGPDVSMAIIGDNLVVNKSSVSLRGQRSRGLSPTCEVPENDDVYQNLEFMKRTSGGRGSKRVVPEPSSGDELGAVVPVTVSEEPLCLHNYTNVELAQASAQGQSGRIRNTKKAIMTQSPLHTTPGFQRIIERKTNASTRDSSFLQSHLDSTSSDDALNPPPETHTSRPSLQNSLPSFELNTGKKQNRSLHYYNFFAPKLPAHFNSQKSTFGLRNKFTILSTSQKSLHSDSASSDHDSSELLSPTNSVGSRTKVSRCHAHNSVTEGKLTRRSSSCDCLDSLNLTALDPQLTVDERPESHNAIYDKLAPHFDLRKTTNYIYGEDLKSGSSSPDMCESIPFNNVNRNYQYDRKVDCLKHGHKYEYIDVDLESKQSDVSGSTSSIGMEHPSDWTKSLPVSFDYRQYSRTKVRKETKTFSRRKHLPLQESDECTSSETSVQSVYSTKESPPRLSKQQSVDIRVKNTNRHDHKPQPISPVDSSELASSTESVSESNRESVFSNASISSGELDVKHSATPDHMKQERYNSPSYRVTHEQVSIKSKFNPRWSSTDETDSVPLQSSEDHCQPSQVTKNGLRKVSPHSESSLERQRDIKRDSSPLPPRSQDSIFTVNLPKAQFNFVKPPLPPKPKVLNPSDSSYTPITFVSGGKSVYSTVDPTLVKEKRKKISVAADSVPYVAVDFEMTAGLQRTSEQVADHQREYFHTK